MMNNMIFPTQSNVQLAKKGDNSVNASKYKSSQISDFRNIMTEAKNNMKSNVSKKVYKNQESYGKNDNKFDSLEETQNSNDADIKNSKLKEKLNNSESTKAIEEPKDEEKTEISDENKDVIAQMENILNLVHSMLKDIKDTNQESNDLLSDQEITDMYLLLDKMKIVQDSNSFLSNSELDQMMNKLKEILSVDHVESKDFPETNLFMELQSEFQNLLKTIDEKGTKENEMANVVQIDLETKEDSYINKKSQDSTNPVNSNRPSNNEDIEVKSMEESTSKENQNTEKGEEKAQASKKTDTGKLIQKVVQKVIIEPKDPLNAEVKLDNIARNGIDKVNLVDKPAPLYKMEVLKQIVEKAQVLLGNDTSEMDMQLRPENLGKLSLKVVIEKGLMSARFIAESQQVKEVIESNFNQLKDMLQQKGIDVQSFSVSVGQQNKDSNNNGYRAWKDSISSSVRKLSIDFADDMDQLFIETKNPYEYHEGSVDYKA